MKKFGISIIILTTLAFTLAIFNLPAPVAAAPQFQLTPFFTPTPNAVGQVLYEVQDGDTLWRISAVSGVSLADLRNLNSAVLGSDDVVSPGMILVLGIGGSQATATFDPNATPIAPVFTPTATLGVSTGTICVLLYNDVNGDSLRQEDEYGIDGGAISITERLGNFSDTKDTFATSEADDVDICFGDTDLNGDGINDGIPAGEYNITVAIPDGYNPTTELSKTIELTGGQYVTLRMGAQPSTALESGTTSDGDTRRAPLFAVLGIGLILGSFVMAYLAYQRSRVASISRN